MTIEEIIKTLNEFVPFSEEDTVNDNESYLRDLMNAWLKAKNKEKGITSIFQLMERYPHADFGSPGPLVHALESCGVESYERELHRSLMRKPTPMTIWVYNRIINQEENTQIIRGHLERLKLFCKHPQTDIQTKSAIERFINHQQERL